MSGWILRPLKKRNEAKKRERLQKEEEVQRHLNQKRQENIRNRILSKTELRFNSTIELNDDDIQFLVDHLRNEQCQVEKLTIERFDNAEYLKYRDPKTSDSALTMLFKALRDNKSITSFEVFGLRYKMHSNLSEDEIQSLQNMITNNTTMQDLDLSACNLKDRGCIAIANGLHSNQHTSVTTLKISQNYISDEGIEVLAQSLTCNTTITELSLPSNNISDEGIEALAQSLSQNTTITSLNLKDNQYNDSGCQALTAMLQYNTTLKELKIGKCLNGKARKLSQQVIDQIRYAAAQQDEGLSKLYNGWDPILIDPLREERKKNDSLQQQFQRLKQHRQVYVPVSPTMSNTSQSYSSELHQEQDGGTSQHPTTLVLEEENEDGGYLDTQTHHLESNQPSSGLLPSATVPPDLTLLSESLSSSSSSELLPSATVPVDPKLLSESSSSPSSSSTPTTLVNSNSTIDFFGAMHHLSSRITTLDLASQDVITKINAMENSIASSSSAALVIEEPKRTLIQELVGNKADLDQIVLNHRTRKDDDNEFRRILAHEVASDFYVGCESALRAHVMSCVALFSGNITREAVPLFSKQGLADFAHENLSERLDGSIEEILENSDSIVGSARERLQTLLESNGVVTAVRQAIIGLIENRETVGEGLKELARALPLPFAYATAALFAKVISLRAEAKCQEEIKNVVRFVALSHKDGGLDEVIHQTTIRCVRMAHKVNLLEGPKKKDGQLKRIIARLQSAWRVVDGSTESSKATQAGEATGISIFADTTDPSDALSKVLDFEDKTSLLCDVLVCNLFGVTVHECNIRFNATTKNPTKSKSVRPSRTGKGTKTKKISTKSNSKAISHTYDASKGGSTSDGISSAHGDEEEDVSNQIAALSEENTILKNKVAALSSKLDSVTHHVEKKTGSTVDVGGGMCFLRKTPEQEYGFELERTQQQQGQHTEQLQYLAELLDRERLENQQLHAKVEDLEARLDRMDREMKKPRRQRK